MLHVIIHKKNTTKISTACIILSTSWYEAPATSNLVNLADEMKNLSLNTAGDRKTASHTQLH
jgi:hypothetical protein